MRKPVFSCVWLLQFIGGDPDKDIAVLQLLAPEEKLAELKPISIGSSTNLQVGQKVHDSYAIMTAQHMQISCFLTYSIDDMLLPRLTSSSQMC